MEFYTYTTSLNQAIHFGKSELKWRAIAGELLIERIAEEYAKIPVDPDEF